MSDPIELTEAVLTLELNETASLTLELTDNQAAPVNELVENDSVIDILSLAECATLEGEALELIELVSDVSEIEVVEVVERLDVIGPAGAAGVGIGTSRCITEKKIVPECSVFITRELRISKTGEICFEGTDPETVGMMAL